MKKRILLAADLMLQFAERTGLTNARPSRRYLWTDAFALCNFLALARATGDERHRALAYCLVDRVHHELGRHRPDEHRAGRWISGLTDDEAEEHPTKGGLRIGKPLPERQSTEPFDSELEWNRDGQYFHYLTKWMHALDQVARSTEPPLSGRFHTWARDLAVTAHAAFAQGPSSDRRMVWKLSIDLSRPLVGTMGQHDPLDGWVTCLALDASAAALGLAKTPSLATAESDYAKMLARPAGSTGAASRFESVMALATSDPLGIGGLLFDALRLVQVGTHRGLPVSVLLEATRIGLQHCVMGPDLRAPSHRRLAFRELGLAIGLSAVAILEREPLAGTLDSTARSLVGELSRYAALGREIEAFWLEPDHRGTSTWLGHRDINDVMLATSLLPDGFLGLLPVATDVAPRGRHGRTNSAHSPSPSPRSR